MVRRLSRSTRFYPGRLFVSARARDVHLVFCVNRSGSIQVSRSHGDCSDYQCDHILLARPFFPRYKYLLIVGYLVTISSMVVLAAGTKATGGRLLIVLGASVFYMSDIFLANWQFVDQNAGNAFYCYPLYYTAFILLALSAGRSGSQIIQ